MEVPPVFYTISLSRSICSSCKKHLGQHRDLQNSWDVCEGQVPLWEPCNPERLAFTKNSSCDRPMQVLISADRVSIQMRDIEECCGGHFLLRAWHTPGHLSEAWGAAILGREAMEGGGGRRPDKEHVLWSWFKSPFSHSLAAYSQVSFLSPNIF